MVIRFTRQAVGVFAVTLCLVGCQLKPQNKIIVDRSGPGCVPALKNPERHEAFMKDKAELLAKGDIQLVFLGDSITDGWRGGPQNEIYKMAFGKYNAFNTGIGGDQTQHLLWRIDKGELDGLHPKVVEIMIGTNNLGNGQTPEQTIAGVTCVVEAVKAKCPDAKVLLLAVFPRGEKADDPFRAKIAQVNTALAAQYLGDAHVKFLDIGPKFLLADGTLPRFIMPDSLHPNAIGYQIWADATAHKLEKLMK